MRATTWARWGGVGWYIKGLGYKIDVRWTFAYPHVLVHHAENQLIALGAFSIHMG